MVPVGALVAGQPREQQAQAVEQLCGGAEGGPHSGHAGALPQREGGRHMLHLVDAGPCALGQASARIGAQRLEIATRPLRIEHAQGQRRLARARHPGDPHELAQRHRHIDVLQVVDARAAHLDGGRPVAHVVAADDLVWHGPIISPAGMGAADRTSGDRGPDRDRNRAISPQRGRYHPTGGSSTSTMLAPLIGSDRTCGSSSTSVTCR